MICPLHPSWPSVRDSKMLSAMEGQEGGGGGLMNTNQFLILSLFRIYLKSHLSLHPPPSPPHSPLLHGMATELVPSHPPPLAPSSAKRDIVGFQANLFRNFYDNVHFFQSKQFNKNYGLLDVSRVIPYE
jgi:hypothetical protein